MCTSYMYFQRYLFTKLLPVSKAVSISEARRTDRRLTLANVLCNKAFPNVCVHHCPGFSTHLVSTCFKKAISTPWSLNIIKSQNILGLPFSVQCSADTRRTIVFLKVSKASTTCPSDKIGVTLNTSMALY